MTRTQISLPVLAGLCAAAAFAGYPAAASVKPADVIACELGGDCPVSPPEQADASTNGAPAVEEEPPTRGWSLGSKPKAKEKAAEPVVNRPAQRVVPARPRQPEVNRIDVRFELGSAEIRGDAASQMDEIYAALSRPGLAGKRYRIVGHTAAVGSPALNRDLSMRRAKAVVDFLAAKGLDAAQFEVAGQGDTAPLSGVTHYDPANRRVEVVRID